MVTFVVTALAVRKPARSGDRLKLHGSGRSLTGRVLPTPVSGGGGSIGIKLRRQRGAVNGF